eukprot:2277574-Pleurochrysis_carterae.AAC.2
MPLTPVSKFVRRSMIAWTTPNFVFFTCPSPENWEKGHKAPKPKVRAAAAGQMRASEHCGRSQIKTRLKGSSSLIRVGRKTCAHSLKAVLATCVCCPRDATLFARFRAETQRAVLQVLKLCIRPEDQTCARPPPQRRPPCERIRGQRQSHRTPAR